MFCTCPCRRKSSTLSDHHHRQIGIGFATPKAPLNRLPGWEPESWAYHGDDGFSFSCTANGKQYGPKFSSADVIGCGMDFRTGSAFFTKNGIMIGKDCTLVLVHTRLTL